MDSSLLTSPEKIPYDIFKRNAPELEPGQDVNGRYLIGDVIAKTNSSNVFDAIDGETEERVAFKAHVIADTDMLGAFVMESVIGRALSKQNSNVVKQIEAGISQDYDHTFGFTVTRKMPGMMSDRIKQAPNYRLPLDEYLAIALPALEAVDEMHNRLNLVHADIKPGNIAYTVDGQGRVNGGKINDFGRSRVESVEPKLLQAYSIPPESLIDLPTQELSPYYMPPEVFMGESDCTRAGDSFSVAVMGCLALTGRYPEISTPSGTGKRSLMEEVSPPTPADFDNTRVQLPDSTIQLHIAGCDKDPDNRPQVTEFVHEYRTLSAAHHIE